MKGKHFRFLFFLIRSLFYVSHLFINSFSVNLYAKSERKGTKRKQTKNISRNLISIFQTKWFLYVQGKWKSFFLLKCARVHVKSETNFNLKQIKVKSLCKPEIIKQNHWIVYKRGGSVSLNAKTKNLFK